MEQLCICVCTRNRPLSLKRLLLSIFDINTDNINPHVTIIIVENEFKPKIKCLVKELQPISPFQIKYFLEPKLGISTARNRAIKESRRCDFIVFVDDDQRVKNDWLIELIKCQREFDADAVYGLTPPIFKMKVPEHIMNFFEKQEKPYGKELRCAATGCLLLKNSFLSENNLMFDERLNFLGGEDVYLTRKMVMYGAKLINNSRAIAYECIPQERASIKYIMKRSFRDSVTYITVSKYLKVEKMVFIREMLLAFIKIPSGLFILVPYYLFSIKNKLKGIIMVSRNIGVIYSLCGKTVSFYK